MGSDAPLVSLGDIRQAAARIASTCRVTPLVDVADASGAVFSIKCENLQVTGSFKLRGAFNALAQLDDASRRQGVVAHSSGNHGQAVAYAARALGIRATIVMPETASPVKVAAVRDYGAEVIFAGTTSAHRQTRAEAEAVARGLTMIPPFDHAAVIAGAGTTGLEILEQRPDLSVLFVPMGGGGQIAGVSAAIKALNCDVRIVGVEPSGAARMTASLAAGRIVSLASSASIADGLLTLRPGELTFAHVRELVDDVVTVPDERIGAAVGWLFRHARLVAEPSGAASIAAVLGLERPIPRGAVAILSGGNVTPESYASLVLAGTSPAQAS